MGWTIAPLTIANRPFQGIMHLYIENAATYIQNRLTQSKISTISRTEFELRILTQLDLSALDTEYKLAWMSAVSAAPFDHLGTGATSSRVCPPIAHSNHVTA